MILVWKGLGILVAVIGAASAWGIGALINFASQDAAYTDQHTWTAAVIWFSTALLVFMLDKAVSRMPGPSITDPSTGYKVYFERNDSLFFIPIKFWPYIFLVLGFLALVAPDQ